MRIFRVSSDHSGFFLLPNEADEYAAIRVHSSQKLANDWQEQSFYVRDPVGKYQKTFHYVAPSVLCSQADLVDQIDPTGACEGLPARIESPPCEVVILRSLAIYNCLDQDESVFRFLRGTEKVIGVEHASFRPERIGSHSLFRVPENYKTSLYTVADRGSPESELFHQYHRFGWTGLEFELVWRD